MHWWVLPTGPGTDVSSRTSSGGSFAVLYQNEFHDWRTGNQANPFFARLGVLFGKTRIAFVLEPIGRRSRLTSLAHTCWSAGDRSSRATPGSWAGPVPSGHARAHQADDGRGAGALAGGGSRPRAAIRDRLKDVMRLLRRVGSADARGKAASRRPEVTGPASDGDGAPQATTIGQAEPQAERARRGIGALLRRSTTRTASPRTRSLDPEA